MRAEIDVTLTFETPFNVGTGAVAGTVADKPMLKDAWGVPYVSGAALKGKLRHECEKIVRALTGRADVVCLSPNPATMCPQQRGSAPSPCRVCQVFGSPWYPAAFEFSDLTLRADLRQVYEEVRSRFTTRYGVGLSRRRKVAKEDLLYTTEIWHHDPQQLVFEGKIHGEVRDDADVGAVALVMAGLRGVKALGGGKSRGLGWCTASVARVQVNGRAVQVNVKEVLERWLFTQSV